VMPQDCVWIADPLEVKIQLLPTARCAVPDLRSMREVTCITSVLYLLDRRSVTNLIPQFGPRPMDADQ
jgi:hypothetical protein